MKPELRSGRLIGFFFFLPCAAVVIEILFHGSESAGFLVLAAIFGLGALLGLHLILKPLTLVRVHKGHLELYPGSLFVNRKQVEIPLDEITRFEVRTVNDCDGSSWVLFLHLHHRPDLTAEAQRWIKQGIPTKVREEADETTLLWSLTWPAGGTKGARHQLQKLLS